LREWLYFLRVGDSTSTARMPTVCEKEQMKDIVTNIQCYLKKTIGPGTYRVTQNSVRDGVLVIPMPGKSSGTPFRLAFFRDRTSRTEFRHKYTRANIYTTSWTGLNPFMGRIWPAARSFITPDFNSGICEELFYGFNAFLIVSSLFRFCYYK
jgi:hypothetical protein